MRRIKSTAAAILMMALIALFAVHSMHSQTPPPQFHAQHIYNETADAKKDISGALALAAATHKNVLLDFGANWCPDCQVLDVYMHQPPNDQLVEKYYIVVHVDVGKMDKNLDVAYTFNVPINKGIPALAVVASSGRVIYSQKQGEFNKMRAMQSSSLTEFLKMWKPQ
jgi:thiol:disulfide interchange protein